MTNKKIKLRLSSLDHCPDGALINVFIHEARRAGWTEDEIAEVKHSLSTTDHDHLLHVLSDHCEDPIDEDDVYDPRDEFEDVYNDVIDEFEDSDQLVDEFEDEIEDSMDDLYDTTHYCKCDYCHRPSIECEVCSYRDNYN